MNDISSSIKFEFDLPPNSILQQVRIYTEGSHVTLLPIVSPAFKRGDLVKTQSGHIGVLDTTDGEHCILAVSYTSKHNLKQNTHLTAFNLQYATQEEKDLFFDLLFQDNYSFDFEKFELVNYNWHPSLGDTYYSIFVHADGKMIPCELIWEAHPNDYVLLHKKLVFKTLEKCNSFINLLCTNTKSKWLSTKNHSSKHSEQITKEKPSKLDNSCTQKPTTLNWLNTQTLLNSICQ